MVFSSTIKRSENRPLVDFRVSSIFVNRVHRLALVCTACDVILNREYGVFLQYFNTLCTRNERVARDMRELAVNNSEILNRARKLFDHRTVHIPRGLLHF